MVWNYNRLSDTVREDFLVMLEEASSPVGAPPSITRAQAEAQAKEIMTPQGGFEFFTGASSIGTGKLNISQLKKRKNLDKRLLAALGEIRNPVANVQISGQNISRLLNQHELQRHMVVIGMDHGSSPRRRPMSSRLRYSATRTGRCLGSAHPGINRSTPARQSPNSSAAPLIQGVQKIMS